MVASWWPHREPRWPHRAILQYRGYSSTLPPATPLMGGWEVQIPENCTWSFKCIEPQSVPMPHVVDNLLALRGRDTVAL